MNIIGDLLFTYLIILYTSAFLLEFQVAGYAVGGGHVLHLVCDITIAADNAIFGQTGPKVLPYVRVTNIA